MAHKYTKVVDTELLKLLAEHSDIQDGRPTKRFLRIGMYCYTFGNDKWFRIETI